MARILSNGGQVDLAIMGSHELLVEVDQMRILNKMSIVFSMMVTGGAARAEDATPVRRLAVIGPGARKTARSANGPTGVKGYTAENVSAATKTNTPLVDVPHTVSVVTRENLSDRNVRTLSTLTYRASP